MAHVPPRPLAIRFGRRDEPHPVAGVEIPQSVGGVVLRDPEGVEHHFGGRDATRTYVIREYIASYSGEGRSDDWSDAYEALQEGLEVVEPSHGPLVSPLVRAALDTVAAPQFRHSGFKGEPERESTIRKLRILQMAGEPFDPEELRVWAATNGWSVEHAGSLQELAEGVLAGRRFQRVAKVWPEDVAPAIDRWRTRAQGAP